MSKYRVTFSPNGLEPFTWKCGSEDQAMKLANMLAEFDLGLEVIEPYHPMIVAYKNYRRSHGINHPDFIQFSTASVDEMDENGQWWIVSEGLDEREFEVGEMPAFDNLIGEDTGF